MRFISCLRCQIRSSCSSSLEPPVASPRRWDRAGDRGGSVRQGRNAACGLIWTSGSHSVAAGPAAAAPEILLEMQVLSRPAESETQGKGPSNQLKQMLWVTLMLTKVWEPLPRVPKGTLFSNEEGSMSISACQFKAELNKTKHGRKKCWTKAFLPKMCKKINGEGRALQVNKCPL